MTNSGKTALVVVDHGSRNDASNRSLEAFVGEVAERSAGRYVAVLAAHMEQASPSLDDAFASAAAVGADLVLVILYFLGPGRHSETDVPRLAAEAAARHGLRHKVSAPLGPDPSLIDLVLARAAAHEHY